MEKKITLKTKGMHCTSCEKLIESAVKDIKGVRQVKSDYSTETTEITYEDSEADLFVIKTAIEKEGHPTQIPEPMQETKANDTASEAGIAPRAGETKTTRELVSGNDASLQGGENGTNDSGGGSAKAEVKKQSGVFRFGTLSLLLGFAAILIGSYFMLNKYISINFNSLGENTGIAMLFVIGFLTGFHCIGMCGGFVLSYAGKIKKQGDIFPHLQYGAGKTVSYTMIGALFGLLGSFIAFTTTLRGSIAVIAGIFLVLYGLNMLNALPFLRKFQPRLPNLMPGWEWGGKGPLITGLLNGLMLACGPLMALYIFAAGTGSPVSGAKALFFFGLGTLVPMLTFGWLSHYLSSALTSNVVRFSGVMVIVLGLLMANNGLALLGLGLPSLASPAAGQAGSGNDTASNINISKDGYQVIEMNVTSSGWQPSSFTLKNGVPVRWQINVLELTGCNNEIVVPDYDLDIKLKQGLQTVDFTPAKEGLVRWSCWMGMIRGQFYIVNETTNAAAPPPPLSSGGCGCGGR